MHINNNGNGTSVINLNIYQYPIHCFFKVVEPYPIAVPAVKATAAPTHPGPGINEHAIPITIHNPADTVVTDQAL